MAGQRNHDKGPSGKADRPDLVIKGGALWAGPGASWPRGQVEAIGGKVSYAGPERETPAPPGQTLDAAGGLIMPGLINAHCHAAMVLFRGLADDLPLDQWLFDHIFPAEAKWVSEEMTELCTLLAAGEMLLSGTTTVMDSYFCAQGAARAYEKSGMRAVLAQGIIDFPAPGVPDPAQNIHTAREFVESRQGRSNLLTPALFSHSLYTCSPETLRQSAALAAELGVGWFVHLAETKDEVAQLKERYGLSPARHLNELGLLGRLTGGVHGVWLDGPELDLLANAGVSIIHCPQSNQKLASGAAPVSDWLARGINVGLGTDGAASNNSLDMIAEIGAAARMAKLAHQDPAALPAAKALEMALEGAAQAIGLEGVAGRLEPGYAADAIVLNTGAAHLTPLYSLPSALAYQARGGDLRHAVVNGKVLVQDRRVLSFDLQEVMARVRELAARVAASVS